MMTALNVATTINPRFDHVTPIEGTRTEVTITHRCHMIAELLAVARSGLVDVVLVATDFEMLSLETLTQLAGDEGYGPKVAAISDVTEDRDRLKDLGIPVVSPELSGAELVQWLQDAYHQVAAPLASSTQFSPDELQFLEYVDPDAVQSIAAEPTGSPNSSRRSGRRAAPYDPSRDVPEEFIADSVIDEGPVVAEAYETLSLDEASSDYVPTDQVQPIKNQETLDQPDPLGGMTAVWGPIGAPGVTTISVNMAVESALAGYRTLLIDADTYGAAVAVHLGLLDDTAAIAQACRLAEHHGVDAASLSGLAQQVTVQGASLDVLTGLTRSERWPQLRAAAWEQVLEAAREGWDLVIIDCGFGLEEDEELSFDIPAPQRNATTLTAVAAADTVLAVGTGDPVGFVRLMKGLDYLAETTQSTIVPVINKVSAMTSGVGPKHQLLGVWERFGPSVNLQHFIPWAPDVTAAAMLAGKALAENAPKSQLRQSVRKLMSACAPQPLKTSTIRETVSTGSIKTRLRNVASALKVTLSRGS